MMSVQSSSLASATLDPAPIRRERAHADRARESEAFTLPEPAREPQPRRESDDRSVRAQPAEARRADELAKPDKGETGATGKTDRPAGDDRTAKHDAGAAGEKAIGSEAKAAAAAASGKPEIGALVTLAAAAEGVADVTATISLDAPEKPDGEAAIPADAAALEPGKPDANVIVAAAPQPAPAPAPQALPLLDAAIPLVAVAASPAPTEGEAKVDEAKGGEAKGDEAALETPAAFRPAAGSAQIAQPRGLDRAGEVSVAFAARESIADGTAPDARFGEIVAALAKEKHGPDAGKAAPAEGKPVETPQAPQAPIDLSFLTQTRTRTEAAIVIPASTEGGQNAAGAQTQSSGPATPIHVVPLEIGLQALAGAKRFDIRLDPAELGRVDVSLEISDKGDVTAKLVVDRVETLHLLQRDARTLERAFEQAGLKPSDAGVEISLRDPSDQSGFRQNRQDEDAPRRARKPADADGGDDIAISAQATPARRLLRLGGVDLSI
jgi:flagellar hook-length control protein FliK